MDGFVIDDSWYQKPVNLPESMAAGGVVVRWEENALKVALVREHPFKLYLLPKGAVEPGESLEQAARREIEEEAGLTDLLMLGKLDVLTRQNFRKTAWKIVHYFLYYAHQIHGDPTDLNHDYRCDWFELDALPVMFWPEQQELIEKYREAIKDKAQLYRV